MPRPDQQKIKNQKFTTLKNDFINTWNSDTGGFMLPFIMTNLTNTDGLSGAMQGFGLLSDIWCNKNFNGVDATRQDHRLYAWLCAAFIYNAYENKTVSEDLKNRARDCLVKCYQDNPWVIQFNKPNEKTHWLHLWLKYHQTLTRAWVDDLCQGYFGDLNALVTTPCYQNDDYNISWLFHEFFSDTTKVDESSLNHIILSLGESQQIPDDRFSWVPLVKAYIAAVLKLYDETHAFIQASETDDSSKSVWLEAIESNQNIIEGICLSKSTKSPKDFFKPINGESVFHLYNEIGNTIKLRWFIDNYPNRSEMPAMQPVIEALEQTPIIDDDILKYITNTVCMESTYAHHLSRIFLVVKHHLDKQLEEGQGSESAYWDDQLCVMINWVTETACIQNSGQGYSEELKNKIDAHNQIVSWISNKASSSDSLKSIHVDNFSCGLLLQHWQSLLPIYLQRFRQDLKDSKDLAKQTIRGFTRMNKPEQLIFTLNIDLAKIGFDEVIIDSMMDTEVTSADHLEQTIMVNYHQWVQNKVLNHQLSSSERELIVNTLKMYKDNAFWVNSLYRLIKQLPYEQWQASQSSHEDDQAKIAKLEADLEGQKKQVVLKKEKVKALEDERKQLQLALTKRNTEIGQLKQDLAAEKTTKGMQAQELESTNINCFGLMKKIDELNQTLDTQTKTIDGLKKELQTRLDQVDILNQEKNEAEKLVAELFEQCQEKTDQISQLDRQVLNLKQAIQDSESRMLKNRIECKVMVNEMQEADGQRFCMELALGHQKKLSEGLSSVIDEKEQEFQAIKEKNQSVYIDCTLACLEIDDLEQKTREMQTYINELSQSKRLYALALSDYLSSRLKSVEWLENRLMEANIRLMRPIKRWQRLLSVSAVSPDPFTKMSAGKTNEGEQFPSLNHGRSLDHYRGHVNFFKSLEKVASKASRIEGFEHVQQGDLAKLWSSYQLYKSQYKNACDGIKRLRAVK